MRFLIASIMLVAACGGPAKKSIGNAATGGPASIRAIDWANRTYDLGETGLVTVKDGEATFPEDPDMPGMAGYLQVGPPSYGDVDGDSIEDAVVVTLYNGGGSGIFSTGLVYTLRAGASEPVVLGEITGGDRGDGGLSMIQIANGTLLVERYLSTETDGACCPSKVTNERWRWDGKGFVEDEAARQTVDNPEFRGE